MRNEHKWHKYASVYVKRVCVCVSGVSNPCNSNPCGQGSTCHAYTEQIGKTHSGLVTSFICICQPGYTGTYCTSECADLALLDFADFDRSLFSILWSAVFRVQALCVRQASWMMEVCIQRQTTVLTTTSVHQLAHCTWLVCLDLASTLCHTTATGRTRLAAPVSLLHIITYATLK